MTKRVFVISDTHFSHTNSWEKFKRADGSPLRPYTSNEQMDQALVDNWNSVVTDQDTVYHLGDVALNRKGLVHTHRLNGRKILIKGNHDTCKLEEYSAFADVRGVMEYGNKCVFTHVPVHPNELVRFRFNIHGHLHDKHVVDQKGLPDNRYFCASVERINFTPILLDEVLATLEDLSK